MYEGFSERAQRVMMVHAKQVAHRFNHAYVGTEHVLLGLLEEPTSSAVQILEALGINLAHITTQVNKYVQVGPEAIIPPFIPLTPRMYYVLGHARKEAVSVDDNLIHTRHLLVGLLCEEEGVAAQVLFYEDVTLELVREIMHRLWPIPKNN